MEGCQVSSVSAGSQPDNIREAGLAYFLVCTFDLFRTLEALQQL